MTSKDAIQSMDVTGSYGRTLVIWMWLDRMDAPGRRDVTRHGRDFPAHGHRKGEMSERDS